MADEVNKIAQKIVLEGEKEYSAALKEAQRNLKVLRSELKAETAELGKNATEQQKNETRSKNLQKQIKEQEKVVRAYEKALKEVKENYADNEEAISRWEIKLNNARTALANMRNDLESTGEAFKDVDKDAEKATVATKSFADAFASIADVGDTVSSAIGKTFLTITGVLRDTVSEIWGEIVDLAAKANATSDLAGYWGTSTTEIQKWQNAVDSTFNSFSDLNSIVSKLVLGGKEKKITELLGISDVNYTNKWDYAMAVMDEIYQKASQGEDVTPIYEQIFGEKRSQAVMDLVNDWGKIRESLEHYDTENGGLGMSKEQLDTMSEVAEKVARLKRDWKAFKESFIAGAFGKLTLDLTGNLQGALDALISFMNADSAEERTQAIEDFKQNLTDFFKRLGEAIREAAKAIGEVGDELKNSEDGTLKLIGQVLSGLSKALEWFTDENNIELVLKGLRALADFWVAGKGLQFASKIASVAANIKTIKMFGHIGAGGTSASAAAEAGATAGGTAATGSTFASIAGKLGSLGLTAAIGTMPAWMGLWLRNSLPEDQQIDNQKRVEGAEHSEEELRKLLKWVELQNKVTELDDKFGTDEFNEAELDKAIQELKELGEVQHGDLWTKYWEYLVANGITPLGGDIMPTDFLEAMLGAGGGTGETGTAITQAQKDAAEALWDVWRKGPEGYTEEEFDQAWENFENAFEGNEEVFNALNDSLDKLYEKLDTGEGLDSFPNLTADWWKSNGFTDENGITQMDLNALQQIPGKLKQAVLDGMGDIVVKMDGHTVGVLVAPYVSQQIAADLNP